MDEYKMWAKIKEQDKYCIFCGRKVEPWEGDFSISRRKRQLAGTKNVLKEKIGGVNKCLM